MKQSIFITITLLLFAAGNPNGLMARQMQDSMDFDQQKMIEEMMKDMTPEERKQVEEALQMGKEMQEKGVTLNSSTEDDLKIPQRKDKILSGIPTLSSGEQYNEYLAGLIAKCKANIDPKIISEVDELLSKNSGNTETYVNLGSILLMQKKPVAAIYAAIKTAVAKPELILLQNNMAVILHQTGNPQISVPILQYLLIQNNNTLILNNLAQSYLSLGDTGNAGMYFRACLQMDPDHSESNCGVGLLLTEEGKITEATPYIKKSLKNGYSETADGLMQKHKMDIKFSDIKPYVPEYFNPQKYKPLPPAYTMDKVLPTSELREEFDNMTREWMQKKEKVNTEQNNKVENESLSQIADRIRGNLFNSPFSKKALLMLNLVNNEFYEHTINALSYEYAANQTEYYAELEKQSHLVGYSDEGCEKQRGFLASYLEKSAKNHDAYQRQMLPKLYEWTNQSLYWNHFVYNEEQYKMYFVNQVAGFFDALNGLGKLQSLYPQPEYIAFHCKEKEPEKVKPVKLDSIPEPVCPFKVEIPLGGAKVKWDCKTFEVEGGELIVGGYEKDFRTGEVTLFLGFGAGIFAKGTFIGGFEGGGKIGAFVKVAKDGTIIDSGNKGEIGIDAGIGPFMTEGKLTGILGLESGAKLTGTIMGEEKTIYESDPVEKQVNPEIHIFNK